MVRLFCGVCRLCKCERAHTMEIIRIAIKRKRMWNYWVSMCVMVVVVAVAWWNMSTKTISATRWFFMVPTGKILRSSLLFVLCFFFLALTPAMSLYLFSRARFRIFFVYNFTNRINVCVYVWWAHLEFLVRFSLIWLIMIFAPKYFLWADCVVGSFFAFILNFVALGSCCCGEWNQMHSKLRTTQIWKWTMLTGLTEVCLAAKHWFVVTTTYRDDTQTQAFNWIKLFWNFNMDNDETKKNPHTPIHTHIFHYV